METDIVKEFEDTVKTLERLYVKYHGCAMSDEVYDRFATLRDDTLPALRKQLRATVSISMNCGSLVDALIAECEEAELVFGPKNPLNLHSEVIREIINQHTGVE
jgi:hypothetical protein